MIWLNKIIYFTNTNLVFFELFRSSSILNDIKVDYHSPSLVVRSRNGLSQACCCLVEIYLLFPQFSPRSWHSHLVFPFSSRISHLASTRKYFSSEHLTGFPHHIYHSMFPTNTHESTIGQLLPMTSLAKLLPCANANVKSTEALDGETSVISTVQTAKNFISWTSFKPKLRWDSVYHDFFFPWIITESSKKVFFTKPGSEV